MERRFYPVELRVADDGKRTITGYAAIFDALSVEMWGFRERIKKGAFAASLANGDDVRALWNHNTDWPMGRTKNSTLSLNEDDKGLAFSFTPPDTQFARDFVISIERGDVDQMSFGFRTLEQTWDMDEQDQVIRSLLKVKLYEISPVTFPAYTDTSVSVRGLGWETAKIEIPPSLRQAPDADKAEAARVVQVRQAQRRRRLMLVA